MTPDRKPFQWWVYGALFALAFALNARALTYPFTADDLDFFEYVPPFRLEHLNNYLSPHWGWLWRPGFLTYFALGHRLVGDNPPAFHGFGLILNGVVCVLLLHFIKRLTGQPRLALWTGIIFCAVTSNTQPTWWVASTSTLWVALFYLLALNGWLSFLRSNSPIYAGATVVCFAVSLLFKEDSLTLPLTAGLLSVYERPASWRRFALWEVALWVVAIGYLVVAKRAVENQHLFLFFDQPSPWAFSIFVSMAFGKLLPAWLGLTGFFATGLIVWLSRGKQYSGFALAWMFPVLLFFSLTVGVKPSEGLPDRYAYSIAMGAALLLAMLFADGFRHNTEAPARALAVALLTGILISIPPRGLNQESSLVQTLFVYGCIALSLALWRARVYDGIMFGILLLTALGAQMDELLTGYDLRFENIAPITTFLMCAGFAQFAGKRLGWRWWHGALIPMFAWHSLPWSLLGIPVLALMWHLTERQKQPRKETEAVEGISTLRIPQLDS